MLTEKKTYLCSSCKKMGVKSIRSKVFETFFCPRCKTNTTLFLPNKSILKDLPKEIKMEQPKDNSPNLRAGSPYFRRKFVRFGQTSLG